MNSSGMVFFSLDTTPDHTTVGIDPGGTARKLKDLGCKTPDGTLELVACHNDVFFRTAILDTTTGRLSTFTTAAFAGPVTYAEHGRQLAIIELEAFTRDRTGRQPKDPGRYRLTMIPNLPIDPLKFEWGTDLTVHVQETVEDLLEANMLDLPRFGRELTSIVAYMQTRAPLKVWVPYINNWNKTLQSDQPLTYEQKQSFAGFLASFLCYLHLSFKQSE